MRAYVLVALAAAFLCLAAVALVVAAGLRHGLVDFVAADLVRYQRAKLEAAGAPGVVFVGDSTLGNAIDAREWTRRTGSPALNLALTGSFGYGAALNFAGRAIERGVARRIVVVFSADALTRPLSSTGFILTSGRLSDLVEASPAALAQAYLDLDAAASVLRRLLAGGAPAAPAFAARDYPPQRGLPRARSESFRAAWDALALHARDIVPGHEVTLARLARACRAAGIECVYAHGPIAETVCRNSAAYFEAARRVIEGAGLRVVAGTPVCLPLAELGDAPDHVRPDLRARTTQDYVDLLRRDATARPR